MYAIVYGHNTDDVTLFNTLNNILIDIMMTHLLLVVTLIQLLILYAIRKMKTLMRTKTVRKE